MAEQGGPGGDRAGLPVPLAGRLVATGNRWEPYRLVDADGVVVDSVGAYFGHLQAAGRAELTVRSYGTDLLRWFRFLWAAGVAWDRATRSDARDFCRWLQLAGKPVRPHWRERGRPGPAAPRRASGEVYAPSVRAHSETVLRGFYDFHLEAGTGPVINPFPLGRSRRGGRAYAHHNPMEPCHPERAGLYRPAVPSRIPRSVPDEEFNEIFAALHSHRDRALVAFYVSTGARASELLSATRGGADPGRQLITVVRKGTRELAQLPAFLRCVRVAAAVSAGDGQPAAAREQAAVVVDAAAAVPPADVSRRAPDVRAGWRGGGHRRDAACAAAYRGLPDGRGSRSSAHRCAAGLTTWCAVRVGASLLGVAV